MLLNVRLAYLSVSSFQCLGTTIMSVKGFFSFWTVLFIVLYLNIAKVAQLRKGNDKKYINRQN